MDDSFAGSAARLAGLSGALFGWTPDAFWAATPAELRALVEAVKPPDAALPADEFAKLREQFPDG